MYRKIWKRKLYMKISLAINVAIMFYVFTIMEGRTHRTRVPDSRMSLRHAIDSFPVPDSGESKEQRVRSTLSSVMPTEPRRCHKHFHLLGMRQHWFEFCSFEEFSNLKYLILFPRVFDCTMLNCSISLTYSLEARDIYGKDVVIFTDVYQWLTSDMWEWAHGNRTEGQQWVMITEESPLYGPGVQPPLQYGNTSYDFIDSYKSDSDFIHPYGYYIPYIGDPPEVFDTQALLAGKTKIAAWMGSHCETLQWDRKRFVEELGHVIHLDKYGKCGNNEIPWNNAKALRTTLAPYKFYLSLENSCCEEYVTEKFWRTLELGLVPIVLGAPYDFYLKVAPPHSFIHPDQFDSMEELAIHLVEVNGNDGKYLEYFKWRNLGKLVSFGQEDHYVRPLTNQTHCDILQKHLATVTVGQKKRDFFGKEWYGSCMKCGTKPWIKKFMHAKDQLRNNANIWA